MQLLGIADQQYLVRKPQPDAETRKDRLSRQRESQLWEETSYRLGQKPADEVVRWVRISDRGSDIYEYLRSCQECGHGYVVRAAQNRALIDEEGRSAGNLFERARALASLGEMELELRSRPSKPARKVELQISGVEVCIRAPYGPGHGLGNLPPIYCTVVRVWEENPPASQEALEWILLCEADRTTFELARAFAQEYNARWLCEEFHKGLKTGLKVEELQLERGEALMSATAVKSVVALRLPDVRERARQEPEAAAQKSGLKEVELEVLEAKTGRQLKSVRDVMLAMGQMGGHLNRKRDGLPGWIRLWRGWLELQSLVEGYLLAHKRKKFG